MAPSRTDLSRDVTLTSMVRVAAEQFRKDLADTRTDRRNRAQEVVTYDFGLAPTLAGRVAAAS